MKLTSVTWTEGALGLLGATCLAVYGLSQWQAAEAQAHAKTQLQAEWEIDKADQTLWSEKRISEYEVAAATASLPTAIALLEIKRLGIEVAVFDGTTDRLLNLGAGRIPGTARVGGSGNLAIAAHRDGFFRKLKDIGMGDEIILQHHQGQDRFTVTDTWVVEPTDVSVLETTGERSITLVTCYPFYFVGNAPQRFIVRGVLSEEKPTT